MERKQTGRYLMVLPVPAHPKSASSFEIESAFAQHLRTLKQKLGPLARTLVIAGPVLDDAASAGLLLDTVRAEEGIVFRGLYPANASRAEYFLRLPRVLAALRQEVEQADVVHAGLSPLYRPFEFPALLMAERMGKKTISVTDIDARNTPRMNYQTGRWSLRQYLTTHLLHGTAMHLQQRFAAERFSLVLLKGHRLATDYGRGRPNVKNFLDSAFEAEHLIPSERLENKANAVLDRGAPVRAIYFGRLVDYKGVDHMLRALRVAIDRGANVRLDVVGDGESRAKLEALSAELALQACVSFLGTVRFGEPLFSLLYRAHVLLAAPLSEDTPRSALDALASGEALIAYDTYYYRELRDSGAPVELVPWRDSRALGEALAALALDRPRLASTMRQARAFAEPNTQEAWLDRRVAWTRALFD